MAANGGGATVCAAADGRITRPQVERHWSTANELTQESCIVHVPSAASMDLSSLEILASL